MNLMYLACVIFSTRKRYSARVRCVQFKCEIQFCVFRGFSRGNFVSFFDACLIGFFFFMSLNSLYVPFLVVTRPYNDEDANVPVTNIVIIREIGRGKKKPVKPNIIIIATRLYKCDETTSAK